jgi:hypothetical protein
MFAGLGPVYGLEHTTSSGNLVSNTVGDIVSGISGALESLGTVSIRT